MLQLIDDVKDLWRFWSIRLQMICITLTSWVYIDPASLLHVINSMPGPLRDVLPDSFIRTLGIILTILSLTIVVARGVKQPKLEQAKAEKTDG